MEITQTEYSIAELVVKSKKEEKNIVKLLKEFISVEEVLV